MKSLSVFGVLGVAMCLWHFVTATLAPPQEQKQQVEQLKNGVLTTALAKTQNCADKLRTLLDHAFYWATRSHNDHIQGKLSEASLKLSELLEIMSDPEIQALVDPKNELPDFMKNLQDSSDS